MAQPDEFASELDGHPFFVQRADGTLVDNPCIRPRQHTSPTRHVFEVLAKDGGPGYPVLVTQAWLVTVSLGTPIMVDLPEGFEPLTRDDPMPAPGRGRLGLPPGVRFYDMDGLGVVDPFAYDSPYTVATIVDPALCATLILFNGKAVGMLRDVDRSALQPGEVITVQVWLSNLGEVPRFEETDAQYLARKARQVHPEVYAGGPGDLDPLSPEAVQAVQAELDAYNAVRRG